ncbi:MAG: hypothetical protein K6F20_13615, partial [Bacteroidaceae bacterium]|nr:hypothetical protein [Bacteroidaceae bacterium]
LELHSISLEEMEQNILRNYMELYRAYQEQKKVVPAGHLFEVRFEDIEQDALASQSASTASWICPAGTSRELLSRRTSAASGDTARTAMPTSPARYGSSTSIGVPCSMSGATNGCSPNRPHMEWSFMKSRGDKM